MQKILCSLVAMLSLVALGCGDAGTVPVKGKVLFTDGTPVTAGQVNFSSKKGVYISPIGSDGAFALGATAAGTGAPPDKYQVYLSGDIMGGGYPTPKPAVVDTKFGSSTTSGIEIDVKGSTNNLEIKVDKAAAK